jgi:type IV secretion system protein VirB11
MHFEPADLLARDATVRELMRPLLQFMDADGATDICLNRPGELFVEAGAEWKRYEVPALTLDWAWALANAIATYTEQEISPQKPLLSATLPGGERVEVVVPPAAEPDTVSFSIRRPNAVIRSFEQYRQEGAFDRYLWARPVALAERLDDLDKNEQQLITCLQSNDLGQFLQQAVLTKKNIAVVGDTGSGKTTLMKSICQYIAPTERLITIEDVRELFLPRHGNRLHLMYSKRRQGVADVTPAELIASAMRMYPSRVLQAELRASEAFDFLKLLTTGHSGSITSFHAESCALAPERYVFMCKEHPHAAIYDVATLKRLVALTIDIIVHVVACNVYDEAGKPLRKDRYVAEVHYDPVAKLRAKYGAASLHHA